MTKLIEVHLDDSTKIYLEVYPVDDDSDNLLDPVTGRKGGIHKAKEFLADTFQQIKLFSNGLAESIKNIDFQPDEFEVEFSVKFAGCAGIIISSVSSEASVKVKMKWNKPKEN
jgi:hypothetical protein